MSKHDGDLISRSALEKFIENGLNNPDKTKRFGHDAVEIVTEVHYAPAVDAVEVVRCKDCMHCMPTYDGRALYCTTMTNPNFVHQNHFCSYGERRADHVD